MGNARNIVFWVVLFLLVLTLFNLFSGPTTGAGNTKSYSEFVSAVENDGVSSVTLDGEQVRYRGTDGQDYVTIKPADAEVTNLLIAEDIPVTAQSQEQSGLTSFLIGLLPFVLLIGVWIYFMNRMQGGASLSGLPSVWDTDRVIAFPALRFGETFILEDRLGGSFPQDLLVH